MDQDDGRVNKRKGDGDGAGPSGSAKVDRESGPVDAADSSSAEAAVSVSSTEGAMIGEAAQPPVESEEKDPVSGDGDELTLDFISTFPKASSAGAQGMRSTAVAGRDVQLSPGPITIAQPAVPAPSNIPEADRCPHCGVGAATSERYPEQHLCLCGACQTDRDAVCLECGLRGGLFFPCPGGCGDRAARRRPYPYLHPCLCDTCQHDDHTVCQVCCAGTGGAGAPLGLPPI